MMVDRYLRGVLTVIAGCLVWLCVMGLPDRVQAQQRTVDLASLKTVAQPVILVGTGTLDASGRVDVNFTRTGNVTRTDPTVPVTLPYNADNPMPSRLFYTPAAPLPIEISAVKKTGEWEAIRSSVEDAPFKKKPGDH